MCKVVRRARFQSHLIAAIELIDRNLLNGQFDRDSASAEPLKLAIFRSQEKGPGDVYFCANREPFLVWIQTFKFKLFDR